MDFTKLIEKVTDKNRITRFVLMFIGVFVLALNYNLFLTRNELVVGGMSGLAIIFNKLFSWNVQVFIYISNVILLFISFLVFGFRKTRPALIGSLLYPLMVTFTAPLSNILAKYFIFEDFITVIVLTSIFYGVSNALIYKMGFNTGGSDIIIQIMKKYLHMSDGRANLISSSVVIILAAFSLGITKATYGLIIVYISSIIVDKMLIGISKSKLFIIDTSKVEEVRKVIMDELHYGVTILNAKGGYSNKEKELLMCAIPTKDYYLFKEIILAIDKEAFFIINDCYDIEGGTTRIKESGLDSLF